MDEKIGALAGVGRSAGAFQAPGHGRQQIVRMQHRCARRST